MDLVSNYCELEHTRLETKYQDKSSPRGYAFCFNVCMLSITTSNLHKWLCSLDLARSLISKHLLHVCECIQFTFATTFAEDNKLSVTQSLVYLWVLL
jgi:hypothetical protein